MRALVTGGLGFIGTNLALQLQANNAEVKVLDNAHLGSLANGSAFEGQIVHGDIIQIAKLFKGWSPEVIFHQAAITDTTLVDNERMFRVNVHGFRAVLDYARAVGGKLVYASSAGVYGANKVPMAETQAPRPLNVYGESKLVADQLAQAYVEQDGLIAIGLRYFNVYGPRESHKGKMASMVWQLALQMAQGKQPRIFKWGEQTRDQIYVADVVKANLLASQCNTSGIFNVGTATAVSFNEIVTALNDVLGCCFQPYYIDNPYNSYQEHTLADLTAAKAVLGFEPEYPLDRGVKEYFQQIDIHEIAKVTSR